MGGKWRRIFTNIYSFIIVGCWISHCFEHDQVVSDIVTWDDICCLITDNTGEQWQWEQHLPQLDQVQTHHLLLARVKKIFWVVAGQVEENQCSVVMLPRLWPDSSGETYHSGSDFLLIIQFSLLMFGEQVRNPFHPSLQPLIWTDYFTPVKHLSGYRSIVRWWPVMKAT